MVGGQVVDRLIDVEGWTTTDAYRAVFWIYTGIGLCKALLTVFLSQKCERSEELDVDETEPLWAGREETEPLLNGINRPTTSEQSIRATQQSSTRRSRNPISRISGPSRWILLKLCSLFFLDSLGSGMVPFSLINFYLERKFQLHKGKLGGIMSATWFVTKTISTA